MPIEQARRGPRAWTIAIIAGTICVSLMSALGVIQWRQARNSDVLRSAIERSHDRQRLIGTYLSQLQDIESGQRGYLVTGNPAFREPFDQALGRLGGTGNRLARLYPAADPARPDVAQLLAAGRARAGRAATNVRLWDRGFARQAVADVKSGAGKRLMDEARRRSGVLTAREDAALRQLLLEGTRARASSERSAMLVQLAVLVALLVLVWAVFRTVRGLEVSAARLRDSATRQSAIFDSATDAMLMLDAGGAIESMNASAERLFGRKREEMVGVSNLALFADPPSLESSRAYLDHLARKQDGTLSKQDFVGLRGDGTLVDTEVVTTPIRLEDGLHFLAVARDATDRRRMERLKNEFVATVSHELRTPLTSIAGSLGLLSGGAAGALPAKALRLVEIAHGNSDRLIRLINDILDIEKIESDKLSMDLKALTVCKLLDEAVHANAAYAARHQVELSLDPCPEDWKIVADHDRFMQVLTNLLSNAVKFSPAGGKVRISATAVADRIRIGVTDEGPGIDEQFRSKIFGKFAQADSTDARQQGGTGLGLSIVKELVTRMDGKVGFDSAIGKGTTFTVDFRTAPPDAPRDENAKPLGRLAGAELPQLLHADDDPDTLRLVASAFEGRADVHSTPSVAEASASLHRYEFDAVILDISMSDGSGLDLVPLIRRSKRHVPIVLFTALDEEPGAGKDADAYLTKSKADLATLVATLARLLQSRAA